ncbi:hypothetical protein NEF87_001001 [Candidatus Lokiarchaeum ossiferum]|uniref:ERCC4 domain-containing protein n=1 Tax=Candidatus Lokiarchaeum ossiferum TaxID=2951803 RepID=A0ABY6HQ89_9ARCH|nr:hypothetical protein NEF87_001001 [Candidatus Lokiarchaeum sp. B-35]
MEIIPSKAPDAQPTIIMDERERGKIKEEMIKLPCSLQIKTLEMGDYILSERIAVERKRGDDFVSSIFDSRLFIQLEKLKQSFLKPIIILESPNRLFERKFINKNSITGAMIYMIYRMDIPLIPTKDEKETANFLLKLAKSEQKLGHWPDLSKIMTNQFKNAKITREDQIYFLQGLVDIGKSTAEKYINIFGTPYFALQALLQTDIIFTKNGNPKGISGLMASIKGSGPKMVSRNHRMLKMSYKMTKKSKEKTRQ